MSVEAHWPTLEKMFGPLAPRGIGRFLVDLPRSFRPWVPTNVTLEQITSKVVRLSRDEFLRSFSERKEILENARQRRREGFPSLRLTLPLIDGAPGGVFDRAEHDGSRASRTLELWGWRDGYQLRADIKAKDVSFPEFAGDPSYRDDRTDLPERLVKLQAFYQRMRGRDDLDVPKEQGTCIPYGFVKGPPSDDEDINLFYLAPGVRDLYFDFTSLADLLQTTELLDRGDAIEKGLKRDSGYTLRKGKSLSPIPRAQEWLATVKSSRTGLMKQRFVFEANSKISSAATPLLAVDMVAGGTINDGNPELVMQPTLTEAQAIVLWDKVTATLRPRPGAF